jgi:hypothetical protein
LRRKSVALLLVHALICRFSCRFSQENLTGKTRFSQESLTKRDLNKTKLLPFDVNAKETVVRRCHPAFFSGYLVADC